MNKYFWTMECSDGTKWDSREDFATPNMCYNAMVEDMQNLIKSKVIYDEDFATDDECYTFGTMYSRKELTMQWGGLTYSYKMHEKNINELIESLQWKRTTKNELVSVLYNFFRCHNITFHDATMTDDDIPVGDYAFDVVMGDITLTIWYLKMREQGKFLITGAELLDD